MANEKLQQIRFVAPIGSVGIGISDVALDEALAQGPHFIACDAGTTDAGPFSLGTGIPAFPREAVKRDLSLILRAGRKANIPVIIGSAGTAGGDIHVDWVLEIAREIVSEHDLTLRTAVIYAEQDRAYLKRLLHENRILSLSPAPPISDSVIDESTRIVGMMGVEPLQEALSDGANFVLAGRCSDSALFAAIPLMHGFPPGLAWHAGKVSECGTLVCETYGMGVIFTTVSQDEITIRPYGAGLRCTPQSVAAHSLYENANPYLHRECSGTFDLTKASFEAIDNVTVRIRGSNFISEPYTVKLEGAELAGYQSIIVGGIRDPYIIRQLDDWLDAVRRCIDESAARVLGDKADESLYSIVFHKYGVNGVMGGLEPGARHVPHEVGIVLEVTARTQDIAHKLAQLSRQPLLHYPIKEWAGSITGFACLHNPAVIDRGPVFRFSLNHVAIPSTPLEMFRTHFMDLCGSRS
ncbi:MAG TPA: acyclic terpene utilization AtuA family protein [Candidatus Dormibacteraeota bacterium]|nr:acyclic terpene utilization AtuA family protein [Candidatus Dormibacteraeota bacterium]